MQVNFNQDGWEEYVYWQENDKKILKKINALIKDIQRSPYNGIGKPEPLKFNMSGLWSRRITNEHRLVYSVTEDGIVIVQCKNHY